MNKLLLSALLLTVLPPLLSYGADSSRSLLRESNPGFEEEDGKQPKGWKTWASAENLGAEFIWETVSGSEGMKAVGLAKGAQGLTMAWVMTKPISIRPRHKYTLTFSMLQRKTEGTRQQVRINWCRDDRKVDHDKSQVIVLEAGSDARWHKQTVELEAPPDCRGLTLELQQVGTATDSVVYFDDLKLQEGEEKP